MSCATTGICGSLDCSGIAQVAALSDLAFASPSLVCCCEVVTLDDTGDNLPRVRLPISTKEILGDSGAPGRNATGEGSVATGDWTLGERAHDAQQRVLRDASVLILVRCLIESGAWNANPPPKGQKRKNQKQPAMGHASSDPLACRMSVGYWWLTQSAELLWWDAHLWLTE